MKFYVDIILSGENFNPERISLDYGVYFKKHHKKGDYNQQLKSLEIEGYAILSSDDMGNSEDVIDKILFEYEKIFNAGEKKLGIEDKYCYIYVKCTQRTFLLKTKYLKKIYNYFPQVDITRFDEY